MKFTRRDFVNGVLAGSGAALQELQARNLENLNRERVEAGLEPLELEYSL